MLRARLAFDRRPHGGRGRCLTEDIPSLQLLQGDRLEPCPTCQDIGTGFDELAGGPYPVRVLFWRRSKETSARHRCPIMRVPGMTMLHLLVDTLHCMFLGVVPRYIEASLWMCITCNVWNAVSSNQATRDELCIQGCRAELFQWYKLARSTGQGSDITELGDLTPGMLGTRQSWNFTPKGAESMCLIPFVVNILQKYKEKLPVADVDALLKSGIALRDLVGLMKRSPSRPSAPVCKVSWGAKQYRLFKQKCLCFFRPRAGAATTSV